MTKQPEESVAKKLRDTLTESGQTFAWLSRKTGFAPSNLGRWLTRRPDQLTIRSVIIIADALGLDGKTVLAEAVS